MRCAVAIGFVLLSAVRAMAWEAMAVDDLAGLDIRFGKGSQHFYASGRTFMVPRADDPFAAEPSWGYWREEAGRYCAQWPPSQSWICFDLAREGATVRFFAPDGGVVLGVIE